MLYHLCHKGDDKGQNRTPSVWLLPDDNRMTIRMTTASNPDLGVYTKGSLTLNQWCYVAITFDNCLYNDEDSNINKNDILISDDNENVNVRFKSPHEKIQASCAHENGEENDDDNQSYYRLSVYMNGILDIKAEYASPVLFNDSPINFFGDGTHFGPRSNIHTHT